MVAKIVLVALCLGVLCVSATTPPAAEPSGALWKPIPPFAYGVGGVNPWMPQWIANSPWMPRWIPCPAAGSSCNDCKTRVVCTKIGGLLRPCTDATKPHCNLGTCEATPSAECAAPPASAAPAPANAPPAVSV